MRFTTDQFNYNPKTKTFSQEASSLEIGIPLRVIKIKNPKTGVIIRFKLISIDNDFTGEDIYGWNFIGIVNGSVIKVLIIND